jgi:hypothetical protein
VGFNDDPGNYPLQAGVAANIRRMPVAWSLVEPAAGTWTWKQFDDQYASLTGAGLRPLVVALAAPCWAHPSVPCAGAAAGATAPDGPYDPAWAEFIRRVVMRYPAAVGIEIWNEENVAPTFLPRVDPARYTQLLKAAYGAVKSVKRTLPVITGGLLASPVSGSYGMADGQFLAAMYAAGAKGFMDGIGTHPYLSATDPNVLEQTLTRLRNARAAAADASTPLWITETGLSTRSQPGFSPAASEPQQARDLLVALQSVARDGDVRVVLIHRLIDRPASLGGAYAAVESGFGVFHSDGSPKPAACALSRELGGKLNCP